MASIACPSSVDFLNDIERLRQDAGRGLDPANRSALGQFFTPMVTARLMASMASAQWDSVRLLDPGAGVGVLTAAWVAEMCARPTRPRDVTLTAYELDDSLLPPLRTTLAACKRACAQVGVECRVDIRNRDFIADAVEILDGGLWGGTPPAWNLAILNPPYKKFRTDSAPRLLLRRLGLETTNLYTAFVSLAIRLLADKGEMVAITPRSFCNGPYFRPFRQELLRAVSLNRLHLFESRDQAFREDDVLQENIILHARKGLPQQDAVTISQTNGPEIALGASRTVAFDRVVRTDDADCFIHLVPDASGLALADMMRSLPCTLDELGLCVSTGRVVDFRARDWLRASPERGTVPLIYPTHFTGGYVEWPRIGSKKPNAIVHVPLTEALMVPGGIYVLVKRFSSKEERRRVVSAVFDSERVPGRVVGFENHLNYFHAKGGPLGRSLAVGLATFLNSTQVDSYFRQFNGHTQVNATDLRALRYPTRLALECLGKRIGAVVSDQGSIDVLVDEMLLTGQR